MAEETKNDCWSKITELTWGVRHVADYGYILKSNVLTSIKSWSLNQPLFYWSQPSILECKHILISCHEFNRCVLKHVLDLCHSSTKCLRIESIVVTVCHDLTDTDYNVTVVFDSTGPFNLSFSRNTASLVSMPIKGPYLLHAIVDLIYTHYYHVFPPGKGTGWWRDRTQRQEKNKTVLKKQRESML